MFTYLVSAIFVTIRTNKELNLILFFFFHNFSLIIKRIRSIIIVQNGFPQQLQKFSSQNAIIVYDDQNKIWLNLIEKKL